MIKTSSGTVYYTQQEVNNKINEVMEDGYKITNAIIEKARDQDWCDEYDEWAKYVNKSLKFFEIPLMRTEWTVTYTIQRVQTAEVTVEVTAKDEDHAEQEACDEYSVSDLVDKTNDNDWTTKDETIESTQAQEV
jgi:phosphosulfolactate synthase (CoM biosynthesis protein A)